MDLPYRGNVQGLAGIGLGTLKWGFDWWRRRRQIKTQKEAARASPVH